METTLNLVFEKASGKKAHYENSLMQSSVKTLLKSF